MRSHKLLTGTIITILLVTLCKAEYGIRASGDSPSAPTKELGYAPDRVIIKFRDSKLAGNTYGMASRLGAKSRRRLPAIGAEVWNISIPVDTAIALYRNDPSVEYIEPDYIISLGETTPDDPSFPFLWGLHNTGQDAGTPDADIDAPEAWDLETGDGSTIVAVIDTGIDYTHVDLVANMWANPGEVAGDSIDNDGNGYVDDVHGIDLWNGDADPMDDNGHGTHCAGIIGAVGNNGTGVVGVSWDVQLMALKFLDSDALGYTSGAVEAIQYAIDHGAQIMNNSWRQLFNSQALYDAIAVARDAGILFVAAAGNESRNTDAAPVFPASYDLNNIISVAASDHNDNKAWFSNYGSASVDIAAPGMGILGTVPGDGYAVKDGTSMAAPYVSGLAVLIKTHFPSLTMAEIRDRILYTTDRLGSLKGLVLTGGRINAYNALTAEEHPQISYHGINIDDTGTLQPNGVLEPGETIDFYVVLRNDWAPAESVTATLSSPDPYVTVSMGSSTYGDIDAGEIKENQPPFVIGLAPETPPGRELPFEIHLVLQYESQTYSLTLPFTYTPSGGNAWLYLTDRVDDSEATWPNELWEPGEAIDFYVRIQNDWASSEYVSATLSTVDSSVTVQQPSARYGEWFLIGETKENETPFTIHLDSAASADRKIPFHLTLTYQRNGMTETASIPFSYSATRVQIVDFAIPGWFYQNSSFAIDGTVGYVATADNDVLWSFSALTGELLDQDGLALPGPALASDPVVFSDDRVAIPGWFPSQGIFVADVSDPANLREIGVIPFPLTTNLQGQRIEVDDDGVTGYGVGFPDDRLYAFDIDTLTVIDSLPLPGSLERLALAGDRIALLDKDGCILVVDVADPTDMVFVGTIELPGSNSFASSHNVVIADDGRTGFVSSLQGMLYSFDIIDVELLDPDGVSVGPSFSFSSAVHGTTVAVIWGGLTFIDASNPNDMHIISISEGVSPQGDATVAFLKEGTLAAMPTILPDNRVYVFDVATGHRAADPVSVEPQPNFLMTYGSDDRIGVMCTTGKLYLISRLPVPKPDITISPVALAAEAHYGETITRALTISNTGNLDLMWRLAVDPAVEWLDRQPTQMTTHMQSDVVVTFTTNITPGIYSTLLELSSNDPDDSLLSIPVTLTVSGTPDILVHPNALTATLATGTTTTCTLAIDNIGTESLIWSISDHPDVSWLGIEPTTGTVPLAGSIEVTIDLTAPIVADIYTTTLVIVSNDPDEGALSIPVTLNVVTPDISVAPSALTATLRNGATITCTLVVSNTGLSNLDWSLVEQPAVPWLDTQTTGGLVSPSASSKVEFLFTAPGTSGIYTTTLAISSNDPDENPLNVQVTLNVPYNLFFPLIMQNGW